jgi:protocatechuate 3,4-dioxygenase beta subunit
MLIIPLAVWLLLPKRTAPAYVPSAQASARHHVAAESAPSRSERPTPVEPTSHAVSRPLPSDLPAAPESGGETEVRVGGVVLDPDGNPVARAVVTCDQKNITTTTNEEGRFQLGPEAVGCRATSLFPGFSQGERVELAAGDRNVLRLSRGGAIAGVVLDERGSPVEKYLLAVESFLPSGDEDASPRLGRPQHINDPAGQFLLDRLPAGRYVLTASAEGRPPARSSPIDVEAGRTTHHARITLPRGATLAGTILDAETRRPIEGARVALDAATSTGANAIESATSDAQGSYSLPGVPPGPFSVSVSRDGYRTKIVPGLTTRGAPTVREDITLTPVGDGGAGGSELVGIGAMLAPSPAGVIIAGVIDEGPAARAGLQRGDRLVRIDGEDATALPMSDCVQRLRGLEGSRVSIAVAREGSSTIELTIVRATIVR